MNNDSDLLTRAERNPSESVPMARFRSDYLYELARRKEPEARRELGNIITDLFVSEKLSLREQDIVADILITMLKQAEIDLRRAIAERLATLGETPLRVILYLSNDDIQVARPVLTHSPVLEDMDMILIIETRGAEYWQAIAERSDLRAAVIRALVETRDVGTLRVLVDNQEIMIPQDSFEVLTEVVHVANDISVPLLKRHDLPDHLVSEIYRCVGEIVRADLEHLLPPERWAAIQPHIEDVIEEHVQGKAREPLDSTQEMIDAANNLKKRGKLTFEGILQALRNGHTASFFAQLMVYSDMTISSLKKMIGEPDGRLMAAFCRIHRIDKKIFLKFFLTSQRLRGGERAVDPSALNQALSYYDFLSLDEAKKAMDGLERI